ncbi:MAG: hypothetical protein GYA18_01025 [Chloroflexi bacterium]|nr:hypothetical protein [Chloroflexota bacterium]
MMKKCFRWIKRVILAYLATGLVYGVTGYIYRAVIGKHDIITPWISIPSNMISWSWMVYIDLKYIGWQPQDVLALALIGIWVAIIIKKEFDQMKDMEKGG